MKLSLFVLWMLFITPAMAEQQQDTDIEVRVQFDGEKVIVDLNMLIPATPQEAWAVLTDFDHMVDFVSNMKESKVVEKAGSILKLFQRGVAEYGPINFAFESTREITLTPYTKIQTHMLSGNMKSMDGITQVIEEGQQSRIVLHNESIPGRWIPPVVGKSFIEHETRGQYQEIRNEVIRRKKAAATGKPE
jgi:hypothetical protein